MKPTNHEVTRLLSKWGSADQDVLSDVLPLLYNELRRLAASYLRRERIGHTLQPTALVHEAYLRMHEQKDVHWQSRSHFIAVAAQLMRRILVDHARNRKAAKRGGPLPKLSLDQAIVYSRENADEIVALDESLSRLGEIDSQQAQIVELRVFGGLTVEETAELLKVSPATVKRDWSMAKAWLAKEIRKQQTNRPNERRAA
jgi:RNA polymerase sigma-70 factor (ECF subfamily)